ncbi:hypothetical protein Tco_1049636 [Tanacetum coccineum]
MWSTYSSKLDRDPFELVFERGFEARCQANTPIETYYNLESFVHGAGKPLETIRDTTHGFISTTLSGSCSPMVSIGVVELIYCYDIYAPKGILVPKTLGDRYLYRGQAEVAFPSGIAPQYIRSAQPYLLSCDRLYPRCIRANNILYINRNFKPKLDPQRKIKVLRPTSYYRDNNTNIMKRLTIEEFPEQGKREASISLTMEERGGLVNALK